MVKTIPYKIIIMAISTSGACYGERNSL